MCERTVICHFTKFLNEASQYDKSGGIYAMGASSYCDKLYRYMIRVTIENPISSFNESLYHFPIITHMFVHNSKGASISPNYHPIP